MALIATVNGKQVYSDKEMTAVINTRVTFTDGSWCDVSTGKVHNVGPGYINIDNADADGNVEQTTEGPKRVSASALEVRSITADVLVDVHDESDIEYTISGPADQVKAIRGRVKGGLLIIEGDGSDATNGDVTIIQTGHGRTVVTGGSIVIGNGSVMSNVFGRGTVKTVITGGSSGENAVKVTVKVPQGAAVEAKRVLGKVSIGDTNGPLMATVQGNNLHAGRVASAQLTVQGSGDIHIQEVNGAVLAQVQGSGDIEIVDGDMSSLTATVQGSGDIKVGGSVSMAVLTVQGSGDIRVAHARQRPLQNIMGSGDIRVQHIG